MSKLPEAVPCPDKPLLHLRGGYLCVAAPLEFSEACFFAPAVRALRHIRSNTTLFVVCPVSQVALWQMMPELDGVIAYPDNASAFEIARLIKAEDTNFESSMAWEASNAAKAFKRAGIFQRLGYPAAGLVRYLTDEVDVVPEIGPIEHRVRFYLDLVNRLCDNAYVPEAFRTPALPERAGSLRVILSPDSSYGASHQWPLERFSEAIKVVDARHEGIEWLIMPDVAASASYDKKALVRCGELLAMLQAASPAASVQMVEAGGLAGSIETLRQGSALLACDGNLAHLAAHLGLPAVVIFGPNEAGWKRPLGKQSVVLREHVACSPCYSSKCALDHRCQTEITVAQVVDKLEDSLDLKLSFW